MKLVNIKSCIKNLRAGDEVEFVTRDQLGSFERAKIVGHFFIRGYPNAICLPVAGLPKTTRITPYYPEDTIYLTGSFPYTYCLPMHIDFVNEEINKIYKKK